MTAIPVDGAITRRLEVGDVPIAVLSEPGTTVTPPYQIDHSEEALGGVPRRRARAADPDDRQPRGWVAACLAHVHARGPAEIGALVRSFLLRLDLECRDRSGQFEHVQEAEDLLARMFVKLEVLRLHILRRLFERAKKESGREGSVNKLLMADAEQELARLHLELTGTDAPLDRDDVVLGRYLHSRALSIYGGSAQIQRNIIAQRVLDMPVR